MRVAYDLADIQQLPAYYQVTIPEDYIDLMGHMNVSYYMQIFDQAGWEFFASLGMDEAYYRSGEGGGFALTHIIRYLAEVRLGETVRVYTRVLGHSTKRVHFMQFIVNETRPAISATMEGLGSHANLQTRRTSPYPPRIFQAIAERYNAHQQLNWDAHASGIINA